MARYRIEDELMVHELDGERIAGPVSTRPHPVTGRPRGRWVEFTIYRLDRGGYVLHKVNQSRVWHLPGGSGHVRSPAKVAVADLPRDALYCAVYPPREGREQCPVIHRDDLPDAVLAEQPQYAVFRCADYGALMHRLTMAFRGMGEGAESDPVHRLLAEAALNDPAFAAGGKPVMPL